MAVGTIQRILIFTLIAILLPACSSDEKNTGPTSDAAPPATILDLSASLSEDGKSTILRWTAPGDDGMDGIASSYDLRYGAAGLTESDWASATVAVSRLTPTISGSTEVIQNQLPVGTWFLGIKAADEVPNWSDLSNVVEFVQPVRDPTPPGQVDDLRLDFATSRSVVLGWTATGDDGHEGIADHYDLRYSESAISEEVWETATTVANVPAPSEPGFRQSVTITGLTPETEYFFALRTVDEADNFSSISNVVDGTTVGSQPVQLTAMRPGQLTPAGWSPNGETIAFVADWEGARNIYTVSSWGGTPQNLTHNKTYGGASNPQWTADGERISYRKAHRPADELWIIEPTSGRTPSFLYRHSEDWLIGKHVRSPDDGQIAYVIHVGLPPETHLDLFVVASSGGDPTLLNSGRSYSSLSWSPDGARLLFTDGGAIWIQPADGGAATELRLEQDSVQSPCWSPDGSRIAFTSVSDGDSGIWIVSADGSGARRITSPETISSRPAWSPDGSRVAFSSSSDGDDDIWITSADGTGAYRVTFSEGNEWSSQWSPDGTRLSYLHSLNSRSSIWLVEVG